MAKIKGFDAALEALRGLDSRSQERLFKDMMKMDPEMAGKLKAAMVQFDDLLKVNPNGFLRLCQDVPDAKWVLALRGKTAEFVDEILKPLAKRKSDLIKAALSQLGPQPLSRVEGAQREIILKALELQEQGLLLFGSGDDPLVG